jgi:integrase
MGKRRRARRGSSQIEIRVNRLGIVTCYARYTENGERKFAKLKATDEEAAKIELAEMLLRIRRGEPAIETVPRAPSGGVTVRQLAEHFCGWFGDEDERNFAAGAGAETRDPIHYRRQFWSVLDCHVLPHIGGLDAMAARPKDVKAMKKALLEAKKHNRTVQRALNHTSRLFNWAIVDEELIDRDNPCSRIKKPKCASSTEFYSENEVARMLATAGESMPDLHAPVAFAYYSGCRRGEIAALQWGDVDLEGGRIVVQRSWKSDARKSGKPVVVHIHPHLDAILRAHRPAGDVPADALVFPNPSTGSMRDKFDSWGIRELAKLAKVRRFRQPWHSMRHAQATSLAASGASLAEIRDALGQSTLQMAANYAHLAATAVKGRINALPTLGPVAPSKLASMSDRRARRSATVRDRQKLGRTEATRSS